MVVVVVVAVVVVVVAIAGVACVVWGAKAMWIVIMGKNDRHLRSQVKEKTKTSVITYS